MKWRPILALLTLTTICLLQATPPAASGSSMDLRGVTQWLNVDRPLTSDQLKGKVVLVSFWTYSCINCIRTLPYLKGCYERYHAQGLEIIGVHTPEFNFEKDPENVLTAIKRLGIPYPVAMDNEYRTWDTFGSRTWPSDFLMDASGVVRYRHFGEAHFEEVEKQILQLLANAHSPQSAGHVAGVEAVDFSKIKSRQIYLGLKRLSSLGNTEAILPGQAQSFAPPQSMKKNKAYLVGQWSLGKESAHLLSTTGELRLRFDSSRVNLVVSSQDNHPVEAEIWIDGKPATEKNRGQEVSVESGQARCRIQFSGMYNLTRAEYAEHLLEIRFKGSGVKVYTITFG